MGKIAGVDVQLFIETQTGTFSILAGQQGATLNREKKEIDVTSKDGNGWGEYLTGIRNWSVECDGLIVVGEESQDKLEDAWENGTELPVQLRVPLGTSNQYKVYSGNVVVTELNLEAPVDDAFTYKATLKGTGPLTKATQTIS